LLDQGLAQTLRADPTEDAFMLIGVPLETALGETRVAVTPETAKKLKALGHTVRIQSGAGVSASATDDAYAAVGAEITDAAAAFGYQSQTTLEQGIRQTVEWLRADGDRVARWAAEDMPAREVHAAVTA
jgi:NAD/NADP transhydrogenase alpha subunit